VKKAAAPKVVAPKAPAAPKKVAPVAPPMHEEMMHEDEPTLEMNDETPEVGDDHDEPASDADARGAFDHF